MKIVSKEYIRGRMSAFNAVLATFKQYNTQQIDLTQRVPRDVIAGIETSAMATAEDIHNAVDLADGNMESAMRVVGHFLIDAADKE